MTAQRENLHGAGESTAAIDAAGVEEVAVVPWPVLLRRRIHRRVGISHRWAVLWVVLAGLFSVGFTFTLLVVSLPDLADELHSSTVTLTWAVTGPMLAFGVVGPAFGKAGDLWGHKRIFLGGLLLAGLFSIASALAWNAGSLILFRVLAATAGSASGPAAMAYINRLFEPAERVMPLSYWSLVSAGAPVVGVVLGGPLVEAVGWRVIFELQAPLCLVAFVIALWLLPGTDRIPGARFDIAGSFTLGAGAFLLLLAISQGRGWGWSSPVTIGCFVAAVLFGVAFVKVEQRADAPLVVLEWFRTRNIAFPVLSQLLTNFAYLGGLFLIPVVLGSRGLGHSITEIGNLSIARPLAFSLIAPFAGMLTLRVGERVSGVLGAIGVVVSMLLWATVGPGTGILFILVATAFSGLGLGTASPALTSLTANAVDPADIGVAGAMQQLMTQLGGVMGSAVLATLSVSGSTGNFGPYHTGFLVGAVAAALGGVAALFVQNTPRESSTPATG